MKTDEEKNQNEETLILENKTSKKQRIVKLLFVVVHTVNFLEISSDEKNRQTVDG